MPRESNVEFKVGAFVLIALAGLTIFIFSVTDSAMFEEGKSFKVIFGFANGLKQNAPVRIAGVDEGIVKNIDLFFDRVDGKTKAEIELWVKKDTKIPIDSTVTINQLGLLGEKYVEIVPGVDRRQFYQEGFVAIGKDPIAQEAISERVMNITNQVEDTLSGLNKVIRDEDNVNALSSTLQNLSSATSGINNIVNNMQSGSGTIGRLFYDEALYDDLQGLTSDLRANPWKLLYRPKDRR